MFKEKAILILLFVILFSSSGFLLVDYYFLKSLQIKAFDQCVLVVGDEFSNWVTRSETLKYCIEQVKSLNLDI